MSVKKKTQDPEPEAEMEMQVNHPELADGNSSFAVPTLVEKPTLVLKAIEMIAPPLVIETSPVIPSESINMVEPEPINATGGTSKVIDGAISLNKADIVQLSTLAQQVVQQNGGMVHLPGGSRRYTVHFDATSYTALQELIALVNTLFPATEN